MQLQAWAAGPHVLKLLLIRSSTCCSTGARPAVWHQQRNNSSSSASGQPAAVVCYEDDQHNITAASIPSAVWECLHKLRAAGHEVLLVGGAVRDLLLQRGEPKDYDILTSAQLKQVKALFRNPRIIGRNFPICQLEVSGLKLEISSMHTRPSRAWQASSTASAAGGAAAGVPADVAEHCLGTWAALQPGRGRRSSVLPHAQQLQQSSWAAARRANAAARDFTVNALLYDPFQAVLFDYVGGVADARQQLLRCVGDPAARFTADPACLLRAVRCAARAGLQLEPATAAVLQSHAHLATSLNPTRLTAELTAMLAFGAAAPSLVLLQQTQLMLHLLPLHFEYNARWQEQQQHNDSSSRSSDGGCSSQQHHSGHHEPAQATSAAAGTAAAAGSQLGQLLHGLEACKPMQAQQQQQQQQQQSLLLRIAEALDQHSSVNQPAAAEVMLACLTAPLLVEVMQQAVQQLQQHHMLQQRRQQQQPQVCRLKQQQEQQVVPAGGVFATQLLLHQQVQQAQQQHQQQGASELPLHSISSGCGRQGQLARAFSSSSSGLRLHEPALQLLQGEAFDEVLREQAALLATQVCTVQQLPYPDISLFGAHTPQLAADLLATHVRLCQRQQHQHTATSKQHCHLQQEQQQWQGLASQGPSMQQQPISRSVTRGMSSSSSGGWRQCEHDCQEDWPGNMPPPRTNKQYKRFMQQQQAAAAQAAAAGSLGSIPSPDAMLLAASLASSGGSESDADAFAAGATGQWLRGSRHVHQQNEAAYGRGSGLTSQQHVVHHVLRAAGAGFDVLQQAVCTLQQRYRSFHYDAAAGP